jgi:hypothetical protein
MKMRMGGGAHRVLVGKRSAYILLVGKPEEKRWGYTVKSLLPE